MSDLICFVECGVILPTLHLLSMCVMLWLIYKYLKSMKSEEHSKPFKYLGLTLFCTQTMYCLIHGLSYLIWTFTSDCTLGNEFSVMKVATGSILFVAQYWIMILLLFCRLKFTFDGTAYALSKCAIWAFFCMYILMLAFALRSAFVNDWTEEYIFSGMTLALISILSGFSIISVLGLVFVKKLIDVNRDSGDSSQQATNSLLSTLTKQTILTLTSISSLLVFGAISSVLHERGLVMSSIHANVIYALCSLLDVWNNFICILLSYGAFDDYYMKVCGCCDTKCKQLCGKLAKPRPNESIANEIVRGAPEPQQIVKMEHEKVESMSAQSTSV